MVGKTPSHYQVLEKIEQGGMGWVSRSCNEKEGKE